MKPVQVPIVRIAALFVLTGLLAWYAPLPSAQSSSSLMNKMSRS